LSKRRQHTHAAPPAALSNPPKAEAFTFGDAMPVMDRAEILDYVDTWSAGQWFEAPVSLAGLAKLFRAGVHHSSAIYFKRNVLSATFISHKLLTREEFDKWSLDFLVFGNGYMSGKNRGLAEPSRSNAPRPNTCAGRQTYRSFTRSAGGNSNTSSRPARFT
jgi:capsid portal protein